MAKKRKTPLKEAKAKNSSLENTRLRVKAEIDELSVRFLLESSSQEKKNCTHKLNLSLKMKPTGGDFRTLVPHDDDDDDENLNKPCIRFRELIWLIRKRKKKERRSIVLDKWDEIWITSERARKQVSLESMAN